VAGRERQGMTRAARAALMALGFLTGAGTAGTALAHAHVFILDTVEIVFSNQQVTGLKLRWAFDEIFSDGMFKDFDVNGDRSFDTAEVEAIRGVSVESMKEFGYFTHVWVDGELTQSFADVTLDVVGEGSIVIYEWTITLGKPVDPSQNKLEISIFDDSYFVDVVLYRPNPVKLHAAPGSCSYRVAEDETKAYYYDSIYPEVISLSCPGQ
jgi:ABC-type uncharacterized transport system substrate-binding protein